VGIGLDWIERIVRVRVEIDIRWTSAVVFAGCFPFAALRACIGEPAAAFAAVLRPFCGLPGADFRAILGGIGDVGECRVLARVCLGVLTRDQLRAWQLGEAIAGCVCIPVFESSIDTQVALEGENKSQYELFRR
jgi:hypothetical protein